jgi:hypothetical protein
MVPPSSAAFQLASFRVPSALADWLKGGGAAMLTSS